MSRASNWAPRTLDTESRLNGNPAVAIGIYLSPGANAVQTSARVQQTLDKLSDPFPRGAEDDGLL